LARKKTAKEATVDASSLRQYAEAVERANELQADFKAECGSIYALIEEMGGFDPLNFAEADNVVVEESPAPEKTTTTRTTNKKLSSRERGELIKAELPAQSKELTVKFVDTGMMSSSDLHNTLRSLMQRSEIDAEGPPNKREYYLVEDEDEPVPAKKGKAKTKAVVEPEPDEDFDDDDDEGDEDEDSDEEEDEDADDEEDDTDDDDDDEEEWDDEDDEDEDDDE
jgi:hypothetical protein